MVPALFQQGVPIFIRVFQLLGEGFNVDDLLRNGKIVGSFHFQHKHQQGKKDGSLDAGEKLAVARRFEQVAVEKVDAEMFILMRTGRRILFAEKFGQLLLECLQTLRPKWVDRFERLQKGKDSIEHFIGLFLRRFRERNTGIFGQLFERFDIPKVDGLLRLFCKRKKSTKPLGKRFCTVLKDSKETLPQQKKKLPRKTSPR